MKFLWFYFQNQHLVYFVRTTDLLNQKKNGGYPLSHEKNDDGKCSSEYYLPYYDDDNQEDDDAHGGPDR